jgi:cyclic pyranopterin phosphate synthase
MSFAGPSSVRTVQPTPEPAGEGLVDSHGRVIRDLRISVTDRCNFRCLYCLPETEAAADFYRGRLGRSLAASKPIHREWAPAARILSYEEIARFVRIAAGLGVDKIRLTGGEPLLRREIERLVALVAAIPGIRDLAMTTNGFLFPEKGVALRDAGLKRVSFSLDSLDRENFRKMTGKDGLDSVLRSIDLAQELGLDPVKINAVVIRGLNDHEIESLARFAQERELSLRFIEFMPLDSSRAWQRDLVVPSREILERVGSIQGIEPVAPAHAAETARRWRFKDGRGEIGLIAPVTEPFCGHCNRIRLTADGQIRTCLFSLNEHDLRTRLRSDASDAEIAGYLRAVVLGKEARHHIGEAGFSQPQRTMSCIGG